MQDKIFYSACAGFILGVLVRSFLPLPTGQAGAGEAGVFVNLHVVILFGVLAFALLLFFTFVSKNKIGVLISVFVLLFCFGIWRFSVADRPVPEFFESKVGQRVSLTGEIADEPNVAENNQKFIVEAEEKGFKTRILVTVGLENNSKYGDKLDIKGVLKKPENFITDQGKEFDYVNYLRKDGIFYLMKYPDAEIISRGDGNKVKEILFSVKEKFSEKINQAIREPESLLMAGLILGEKASFEESFRENLVSTGTIHIVALSGYNIMIVAKWFMKFFSFLPMGWAAGAGMFSIFLFVLMTGAPSTAVRAGVMAVISLFAKVSGRGYDAGRALLLAGIVMVLWNPFILRFDVSFQLSFLATVAVIFFAPKVEKYFEWVTPYFGLREIFSITTAVYIFVLPFILYKMGSLSLVALPANVLILPLIPFTMGFGFIAGFAGLIWYFASVPFGFMSYLLLHYEMSVVNFFARVPFASLSIPEFPLVLTMAVYAWFAYKLFGGNAKSFLLEIKNRE